MPLEFLDPIPLIETKRKYSPFRVTPIGGPKEIEKWREMQKAKLAIYQMKLEAREKRTNEFELAHGIHLDHGQVQAQKYKEKYDEAIAEKARLIRAQQKVIRPMQWQIIGPKPKPTLMTRFIQYLGKFWKDANF